MVPTRERQGTQTNQAAPQTGGYINWTLLRKHSTQSTVGDEKKR